jgi:hypothetical protein
LWVLALGGLSLTGLLLVFGWTYVNVPAGWSPRLGPEADATALFPRFWFWSAFRQDPARFPERAKYLLCGLWLAYLVALAAVFRVPLVERGRGLRVVVVVVVVAHLILIGMPPVVSGDLFHYALFGRMVSAYGLNPYVTSALRLKEDPLWPYASWNFLPTHYGPGFTWLSAALTALTGGRVFWTAISFKAFMSAMTLASCWLVRDISIQLGDRARGDDGLGAFALYALNPFVLVETAGMAHNEALVVAYALAGVSLALRGNPWLAFSCFLLSADVKTVTASLALMFAARFVLEAPSFRARVLRLAGLAALAAVLLLLLWAPYWRGTAVFDTSRSLLTTRAADRVVNGVRTASFVVLVLASAVAASRGSMGLVLNLASVIGLVFVLFVFPWQFAWYMIPSLAFAAAAPRTRPNVVLLAAVAVAGLLFTLRYVPLHSLAAS